MTAAAAEAEVARARAVLATVPDPEIPVLSVVDLGIVRAVETQRDGTLRVAVSPTYSGCPATVVIRADIAAALAQAGFDKVSIVGHAVDHVDGLSGRRFAQLRETLRGGSG